MAKKFKVNKEKCIGCGVCAVSCEGAIELGEDGKARVLDSGKLERCGGKKLCPYGTIEEEKVSK